MLDSIGWFGSLLLAVCGLPQAIQSYYDGHSRGLNWGFLAAWTLGEIMTFAYVLPKMDWPLLFNYSANLVFLSIIIRFKVWERPVKHNYPLLQHWKNIA